MIWLLVVLTFHDPADATPYANVNATYTSESECEKVSAALNNELFPLGHNESSAICLERKLQ